MMMDYSTLALQSKPGGGWMQGKRRQAASIVGHHRDVICAVVGGAEGWDDVAPLAKRQAEWFRGQRPGRCGGSKPLGYREFRPLGPGPVLSFREDESRVRAGDAPENLAIIRHAALTLLRKDRKSRTAIKTRRKLAGWDNDYLLSILSN